jgi:hypothetical protein
MIRRVVYLLQIFKIFHGVMNNPVEESAQNRTPILFLILKKYN